MVALGNLMKQDCKKCRQCVSPIPWDSFQNSFLSTNLTAQVSVILFCQTENNFFVEFLDLKPIKVVVKEFDKHLNGTFYKARLVLRSPNFDLSGCIGKLCHITSYDADTGLKTTEPWHLSSRKIFSGKIVNSLLFTSIIDDDGTSEVSFDANLASEFERHIIS